MGNVELMELVVKKKGFWWYETCVGSDEILLRMLMESDVVVGVEV